VGEGGFGRVFEAWDETLSRRCAIKIARKSEENDRLLREARAAASLTSRHTVRIYDVGHLDDGAPYLVMEYLEGSSLSAVLAERSSVPVEEALRWTHQICLGLDEAHQTGVIHRDIKPSNLFLIEDVQGRQVVKLVDFGLARLRRGEDSDVTASGVLIGSPAYMSPEQIRNQPYDARTDIWSTGVVLYKMLCGRHPFPGRDRTGVLASIVADPPEPLEAVLGGISQDLVQVLERCMAKVPADRFATAQDLDLALGEVARTLSIAWPPQGEEMPGHSPKRWVEETQATQTFDDEPQRLSWSIGRRLSAAVLVGGIGSWLFIQWPDTGGAVEEDLVPDPRIGAPVPPSKGIEQASSPLASGLASSASAPSIDRSPVGITPQASADLLPSVRPDVKEQAPTRLSRVKSRAASPHDEAPKTEGPVSSPKTSEGPQLIVEPDF